MLIKLIFYEYDSKVLGYYFDSYLFLLFFFQGGAETWMVY